MPSLPPHKRRKSIAAADKVTSRFLPSEKFEGRSAQVWSLHFFCLQTFWSGESVLQNVRGLQLVGDLGRNVV